MLHGSVTFPAEYRNYVRGSFLTVREERFVYPEFMRDGGTPHATDYAISGTLSPNALIELIGYLSCMNLDTKQPYDIRVSTQE
jgi:hypothetical protein